MVLVNTAMRMGSKTMSMHSGQHSFDFVLQEILYLIIHVIMATNQPTVTKDSCCT